MSKRKNPDQQIHNPTPPKKLKTSNSTSSGLDSMIDDIRESRVVTSPELEEQKFKEKILNEIVEDVYKHLAKADEMRNEGAEIEIEFRIGKYTMNKFTSGMHGDEYKMLLDYFTNNTEEMGLEFYQNLTVDKIHHLPVSDQNIRVTLDDENDEENYTVCRKEKIDNKAIKMKNKPFDIKLGISKEVTLQNTLPKDMRLKIKRKKERSTFEYNGLWRLDLTKVTTQKGNNNINVHGRQEGIEGSTITYEAEFELISSQLENKQKPEIKVILDELYDVIMKTLEILKGNNMENLSPQSPFGINLTPVIDIRVLDNLKNLMAIGFQRESIFDFPGTMPIAFSRKHFQHVQEAEYMISEKSDGLRYLLLIAHSGVYFVDRKYSFYLIEEYKQLIPLFAQDQSKITLIDGELTYNKRKSCPYFLIFDILMVNGEYHGNKNLYGRLEVIGKVVSEFRQKVKTSPFELIGKRFWQKQEINGLFNCIRDDKDSRYFDDKDKRCHKTDGIIFTPITEGYVMKTNQNVLKWKYLDLMTVDFKLVPNIDDTTFSFYIMGPNNEEIESFRQKIYHLDVEKLGFDWQNLGQSPAIAECYYDKWIGFWRYKLMRKDKKQPNYFRILTETLEVLAESITNEELIKRIPRKPNEDDYLRQLHTNRHHSKSNHKKPSNDNDNHHHHKQKVENGNKVEYGGDGNDQSM